MLKKIVILGPESTGKSTLCAQLAAHYKTLWCPEYAREYLLKNGTAYSFDDLLVIAKGQAALEEKCVQSLVDSSWSLENTKLLADGGSLAEKSISSAFTNDQLPTTNYLFIDTNQYVMKVWCEYVFNQCHTWILNRIVDGKYDFYLLCKPDLPWVKDELREYPNEKPRQELYHIYKDMMVQQPVPWAEISGGYDERLQMAIETIDKWLIATK